jgi:hypothetical protein
VFERFFRDATDAEFLTSSFPYRYFVANRANHARVHCSPTTYGDVEPPRMRVKRYTPVWVYEKEGMRTGTVKTSRCADFCDRLSLLSAVTRCTFVFFGQVYSRCEIATLRCGSSRSLNLRLCFSRRLYYASEHVHVQLPDSTSASNFTFSTTITLATTHASPTATGSIAKAPSASDPTRSALTEAPRTELHRQNHFAQREQSPDTLLAHRSPWQWSSARWRSRA